MSIAIPLRVLVVDDHAGIRHGISRLIDSEAPRMCSVGAVGTVRDALSQARALQPDVVLLDVNLEGEDGLAMISRLHGAAPCRVVVLTSLSDPRVAERALALGARACLHKTAPASELIACIAAVWSQAPPSNEGEQVSLASGNKHPSGSGEIADGSATASA